MPTSKFTTPKTQNIQRKDPSKQAVVTKQRHTVADDRVCVLCLRYYPHNADRQRVMALFSTEKCVTVQTHTHTITKNSKRYIHTVPIGMCG